MTQTGKTTRLNYTGLLNALMGGGATFLGGSVSSREAKFLEKVRKVVLGRVKKVSKALPGLAIPEDAWNDQFNTVMDVVTKLDVHRDPVDGVLNLTEEQLDRFEQDLTRALTLVYLQDQNRAVK